MTRRKFGITYVMRKKDEVAESYIEIPSVFNLEVPEKLADELNANYKRLQCDDMYHAEAHKCED